MKRYGLIGKDISYSLSPVIHKTISAMTEAPCTYTLFDIEASEIPDVILKLKQREIDGLNVTKPYKTLLMSFVDQLSETAKAIGAINTIYVKDGVIYGDNTDYTGFLESLDVLKIDAHQKHIAILGSGGAARACYFALKPLAKTIHIVSRQPKTDPFFGAMIDYDTLKITPIDFYVNTVHPMIDIIDQMNITPQPDAVCYDLNYVPKMTPVMKHFKTSHQGMTMLIMQAVKSQSLWRTMDIPITQDLLKEVEKAVHHEQFRQSI